MKLTKAGVSGGQRGNQKGGNEKCQESILLKGAVGSADGSWQYYFYHCRRCFLPARAATSPIPHQYQPMNGPGYPAAIEESGGHLRNERARPLRQTSPGQERGCILDRFQGNLWLFGGFGYDPAGAGNLNDLWKYDPATLNGPGYPAANPVGQAGTYGTKGTAGPSNVPGARTGAYPGSIPTASSGSSAEMAMIRPAKTAGSTTCGSMTRQP